MPIFFYGIVANIVIESVKLKGVAQKLGAESIYFNPAGMAFMTESVDITVAINKSSTPSTSLQSLLAISFAKSWKL